MSQLDNLRKRAKIWKKIVLGGDSELVSVSDASRNLYLGRHIELYAFRLKTDRTIYYVPLNGDFFKTDALYLETRSHRSFDVTLEQADAVNTKTITERRSHQ